jgi:deoxyribonuclease V
VPTIGFAKSVLLGRYDAVDAERGASSPMIDKDEVVGAAVRTRDNVSPVYVSVGHKVNLESAVATVLVCSRKYRLPETTRVAHMAAAGKYPEGLYPGRV